MAPVALVLAGGAIGWRKVADVGDDVTNYDIRGDHLYLMTHKGASRYKVTQLGSLRFGRDCGDRDGNVPADATVIQSIGVAKDALYVRGISAGLAQLRKLPYATDGTLGNITGVPLPFAGTMENFTTDPRNSGAYFELSSWTKPRLVYALDGAGTIASTGPPNRRISTPRVTSRRDRSRARAASWCRYRL